MTSSSGGLFSSKLCPFQLALPICTHFAMLSTKGQLGALASGCPSYIEHTLRPVYYARITYRSKGATMGQAGQSRNDAPRQTIRKFTVEIRGARTYYSVYIWGTGTMFGKMKTFPVTEAQIKALKTLPFIPRQLKELVAELFDD
jgi:hypothetical protein